MAVTRRWSWTPLLAALGPILAALVQTARTGPGQIMPWSTVTADLASYVTAASMLLDGLDYYQSPDGVFPYIYPPIAAILAVPLSLIPFWLAQVLWISLQGVLMLALLRRLGLDWWPASGVASAAMMLLGPFGSTLELGQMGILLLFLITVDLVHPPHRPPRVQGGILTGLATGIKLTPAVFIIHLWLIGRRKDALVAAGTFGATVLVGLALTPGAAWGYWSRLATGDSGANPNAMGWIANISVVSATQRFLGLGAGQVVGLILAVALVVLSLAAARAAHRAGQPLLALGLLGSASVLANPIAWIHHLTFTLLLAAALAPSLVPAAQTPDARPLPRWLQWATAAITLWLVTSPQAKLHGAPWAVEEIHHYSVWQKLMAASPDILVAVLCGIVLIWALRARNQPQLSQKREMESEVS